MIRGCGIDQFDPRACAWRGGGGVAASLNGYDIKDSREIITNQDGCVINGGMKSACMCVWGEVR